jgi:hypothetical protein
MNKTLAKKFVRFLPFRIIYRATVAIPYFASDLVQALRWSLKRTETSNFYYDLTEKTSRNWLTRFP